MTATKQVTMRLPEDLVDWLDNHLNDRFPSRAALVTHALRRAKRRQESQEDLRHFLDLQAVGKIDDDPDYLDWMRTREFPDPEGGPAVHPLGGTA